MSLDPPVCSCVPLIPKYFPLTETFSTCSLIFFEKISTQNMLFIIKSPRLFCLARILQLINLKSTGDVHGTWKMEGGFWSGPGSIPSWVWFPVSGCWNSVKQQWSPCSAFPHPHHHTPSTSLLLSEPPGPLHDKDLTYLNSFKSRSCSVACLA